MKDGPHDQSARPFINVTPLIDVLLVLLIIFMVVTPMKPSRFKALVPTPLDKKQPDVVPIDSMLRVDILNDLRLELNGQEMGSVNDTRALSSKLAEVFQKCTEAGTVKFGTSRIEKTVYIKAPRSVRYGEVVKVIDGIKGAGADPLGLQVDDLAQ
ncbi:MAG: biopolymer transporter ExbD [Pyrinomonadaceae bacterium]|nr:biopolymer transporter ExbD [Pyrinomonadaceae bacterium]